MFCIDIKCGNIPLCIEHQIFALQIQICHTVSVCKTEYEENTFCKPPAVSVGTYIRHSIINYYIMLLLGCGLKYSKNEKNYDC